MNITNHNFRKATLNRASSRVEFTYEDDQDTRLVLDYRISSEAPHILKYKGEDLQEVFFFGAAPEGRRDIEVAITLYRQLLCLN